MAYTMYTPLNVWLDPASVTDVVAYIQAYLRDNPISTTEEIEELIHDYLIAHPELIGGVQSVNGKTGTVVLAASDINTTNNTTIQAVINSLSADISAIVQSVTTLSGRVTSNETGITNEATARANADTALGNRITALQGAVGSPLIAATAAEMTDTSKIYVYTGSETGYTNGNWYYYNGSAWTSGGVYNSIAINTDTTLTVAGMAADAKATGDGLNDLKSSINGEQESLILEYTQGGYINSYTPGDVKSTANWKYTDYIDISANDGFLYISMVDGNGNPTEDGSSYNAFYNSDYSYNSRLSFKGDKVEVPNGAVYIRLSCRSAYTQTVSIMVQGIKQQIIENKNIDSAYIKIGTWNVGIFNDGTTKPTTEEAPAQIVKLLKTVGEMNADVLCTQEWVDAVDASNTISSLNLVSFKYDNKTNVDANKCYSKFEILSSETITFTSGSGRSCRSFTIDFHGKELTIIDYHADIALDPSTYRTADAAQLIAYMKTKDYCILTGDFNAASDNEYDAYTSNGFTLCNGGTFGWFDTWPVIENMPSDWSTTWPSTHLDNIIVSNNISVQYVETVKSGISDHAPLTVILRID